MICSSEYVSLKSAYGFFDACLRAFSAILPNVSRLVPYFQRYSRPAPPNICAAGGAELKPCSSFITLTNLSSGFARSVHFAHSAPAARRVAEHIRGVRLLDVGERDLRVGERGLGGLARHHVILLALSGLG